jgi:hypothetical protein
MLELAIILGLASLATVVHVFRRAGRHLRIPLVMFNGFYFLTSVIGGLLVTSPDFQLVWKLAAGGADVRWLSPGNSATYWVLLFGPFIVTNLTALSLVEVFRPAANAVARNLSMRVSQPAVLLVAAVAVGYCLFNLARNGYLGTSLLGAQNAGFYRENIQLRSAMAASLGDVHFAIVYMILPSLCITSLIYALRTRRASWWLMFGVLSAAAVFMYMTTLTKSNLIIFVTGVGVTAFMLGAIRARGVVLAAVGALVLLMAQEAFLAGRGLLELAAAVSNLVLRLSSAIPFYVEVFPAQEPYVGIDYGLTWFGIGPKASPNLVVFNYMFPDITWVQGAAPAAAHISGYAQAGLWFSLLTMVLVGALIAFLGSLGRAAHAPLARAAFVGGTLMCYYNTQADFVGSFNYSYGFKWWLLGLLAVVTAEWGLRWLLGVPCPPVAKPSTMCESVDK